MPEYEPALQLMLAGADTATLNNFGQTAIVLTEDATMLRLLSAVGKQTADVDVRGACVAHARSAYWPCVRDWRRSLCTQ